VNDNIKFLIIFFLSVGQVLLLIGGFNWWIDPYDIYHPAEYKSNNLVWMSKQLRLAKAYRVRQLRPQGIVIGASTSQLGINPNHPGWGENVYPRYNLALPGANLYESFRYFQHSQALSPQKQILIGLDFISFNIFTQLSDDFNESYMVVSREGKRQDYFLTDLVITLFSLSAIKASQKKMFYRGEGTHLSNGTEFSEEVDSQSRNNRSAMMWSATKTVSRLLMPPPAHRFCLDDGTRTNSSFQYLRQILETAKESKADVRLFIQPAHVYLLEVLKVMGLMEDYEKWQYRLIDLVEDVDKKYPKNKKFSLWDFSGYNSVTMDEVPPAEEPKRPMDWYYDVAHFKKSLGDMIQDRVFNYNYAERVVPEDFGMQINSKNIDLYQSVQRNKRMKYMLVNQKDIKELVGRVNVVKKKIREFDCG
ncbi:uncharacterized protein METZ01_LOCUS162147, partial [marine metagenome]